MRSRCRTIAATNTSAAPWCVCRTSTPALPLSEMFAVDRQRQLRQRPARRAEEDGAAIRYVEGGVVTRADERGPGLDCRERRLAVERDGAAGVRADLGVGQDPARRPGSAVARQT